MDNMTRDRNTMGKSKLLNLPWHEVVFWIAVGLFTMWFGAKIL